MLEDNGERLFLVDPEGKRFEVGRNEIRLPDQFDFEAARIAMSFDPAAEAEVKCAAGGCRQSSRRGLVGEMWYKMEGKAFCETCTKQYALDEGYIYGRRDWGNVGHKALWFLFQTPKLRNFV